jgi:hypothetical protein
VLSRLWAWWYCVFSSYVSPRLVAEAAAATTQSTLLKSSPCLLIYFCKLYLLLWIQARYNMPDVISDYRPGTCKLTLNFRFAGSLIFSIQLIHVTSFIHPWIICFLLYCLQYKSMSTSPFLRTFPKTMYLLLLKHMYILLKSINCWVIQYTLLIWCGLWK